MHQSRTEQEQEESESSSEEESVVIEESSSSREVAPLNIDVSPFRMQAIEDQVKKEEQSPPQLIRIQESAKSSSEHCEKVEPSAAQFMTPARQEERQSNLIRQESSEVAPLKIDFSPFRMEGIDTQLKREEQTPPRLFSIQESARPSSSEMSEREEQLQVLFRTPAREENQKEISKISASPTVADIKLEVSPFRQDIVFDLGDHNPQQPEEQSRDEEGQSKQSKEEIEVHQSQAQQPASQSDKTPESIKPLEKESSSEIQPLDIGVSPYQLRLKFTPQNRQQSQQQLVQLSINQPNLEEARGSSEEEKSADNEQSIASKSSEKQSVIIAPTPVSQSPSRIFDVNIELPSSSHHSSEKQNHISENPSKTSSPRQSLQQIERKESSVASSLTSKGFAALNGSGMHIIGGMDDYEVNYPDDVQSIHEQESKELDLREYPDQPQEQVYNAQYELELLEQYEARLNLLNRTSHSDGLEKSQLFVDLEYFPNNVLFQYVKSHSNQIVWLKDKETGSHLPPQLNESRVFRNETLEECFEFVMLPGASISLHKYFKQKCKIEVIRVPNLAQNYTRCTFSLQYIEGNEDEFEVGHKVSLSIENLEDEGITFKNTSAGYLILLRIE